MSTRLVARMSRLVHRRTSRRGFLRSLVMSAIQKALLWMQLEGMETGGDSRDVTRGEMVSLLYGMAGRPQPAPKESFPAREFLSGRFPDVVAGTWYEDAVDWAADRQIIWWPTHLPFEPDRTVTRAEAAVFLHRYHAPPQTPPQPEPQSFQPWL